MKMSAREVDSKAQKLIGKLQKSGQLNPNLKECIELAETLEDVETLAAPFKASSTTQTLANKARSIPRLQKAAEMVLQATMQTQKNPIISSELKSEENRLQIGYIIADDLLHRPEIVQLIANKFCNDRRNQITSKM